MDTGLRVNRLFAITMPALMAIMNLSTVAVLWLGAYRVDSGEMPIGNLTAFLQYIIQILFAIMMAVIMFVMVPRAAVSGGRIREVLDTEPSISDPPTPVSPQRGGRVEFRDVTFGYPGAEEPVLRSISFQANPGETTAIVGSTGSGKTTLINLLPRFYDATGGTVLVDGVDVRAMDRQDLWRRIGMIPQRAFLFGGTVASNLRYGDEDATDDALWRALDIAQGRDFVTEMPEQLEAPIAQGGTNVSGGQRQRLAIARALVRRPDIYVFDDSFSALDFRTDARLRAALARELGDATVIIVAQRVGTILRADRIVVLENGRIAGIGHARGADAQLRDVPRDRPVPGHRGGGRMSGSMGRQGGEAGRPGGATGPGGGTARAGGGPTLPGGAAGRRPGGPGGGGPMHMGMMMPVVKARSFRTSFRRLLGELRPERPMVLGVVGAIDRAVAMLLPLPAAHSTARGSSDEHRPTGSWPGIGGRCPPDHATLDHPSRDPA